LKVLDAQGTSVWSHTPKTPVATAALSAEGDVTVAPDAPTLQRFGTTGTLEWEVALAGCHPSALVPAAARGVLAVSSSSCKNAKEAAFCFVSRFDADGKLEWETPVGKSEYEDQCGLAPVPAGGAAVATMSELVEISAEGRIAWRRPLSVNCGAYGGAISAVAADERSIFVAAACENARIGTMVHSPYARASAMPWSWVARFARTP
jgi:hypothetical protein